MTLPAGVSWKGCFLDALAANRDLPTLISDNAGIAMTVDSCVQKCRTANSPTQDLNTQASSKGIQQGYQVLFADTLCCT
jgi:hypothetical protein